MQSLQAQEGGCTSSFVHEDSGTGAGAGGRQAREMAVESLPFGALGHSTRLTEWG